ncbi:MAG: glucose-1-phosphate thymidylyltransferase [Candidatus Riflebacteria bacterium]|nr:glucose-1-phosphate thymidylyltransferase [Candidatus Riflebacteria bacterium]
MKGLILSGGRGTRLRPITHTSAKQLVPVANKPILFYGIEAIRDAGITDIGIVVGETHKEIRAAVGDGSRWGVEVSYIEQPDPLGLAHAVLVSEEYLGTDEFVMYLGDNLIMAGLKELVASFRERRPNSQILLARVPNPNQFGVAELEGDRIVRLEEKPKTPRSDLALVGVYMFDRHVFEAARSIKPSARGELEITDAIQWLIDHGRRVDPTIVTGWWKDTGKLEDMLEANRMVLDRLAERREDGVEVDARSEIQFKVVLEQGSRIINSRVQGPAIIGRNTTIVNSYVGPFTSIHYGCRVENSEIEHSIVLEESSVLDIGHRIADSLVGKGVTISRAERKPRVLRFMLGDHSVVGVL